jgi:hypothetical protein
MIHPQPLQVSMPDSASIRAWRALRTFRTSGRCGGPASRSAAGTAMTARDRLRVAGTPATREGKDGMRDFFGILAAGPLFFVSAWLLMIFAGIVATDVGIRPFGYITSMVVTIGLWLTLAPAIGAIARTRKKD